MGVLLILPILIPLLTGLATLLARRRAPLRRALSLAGSMALVGSGVLLLHAVRREGIIAVQIGQWPAPFGISFVADILSSVLVLVTGVMGVCVVVFSRDLIDAGREGGGYHTLVHLLLMGVCGAFLTGDLFNLYVWFEVMLLSSFVLMALGGTRIQLEGSIKYVTLNLLASALFLAAAGLLYGMIGSLNLADVSVRLRSSEASSFTSVVAGLLLIAFGVKAAAFPLFFWLPASYHTPPVPVTILFSALLTKVGVYAILRVTTLGFAVNAGPVREILLIVAGLTMVTGVLGAIAQTDMRRLLAFHIVSQIGYLLMGIGLGSPLALAATLFFIVHVMVAKSALFMVGGLVHRVRGTYDLGRLGGLAASAPVLAVLFLLPALSLAGIPPLSGFWAKLALVKAGLDEGAGLIVGVALAVSVLTLYSMTKIWAEAFWKDPEEGAGGSDSGALSLPSAVWPVVFLVILTVIMGVAGEPFMALALRAGEQVASPETYINVVLQGRP